MGFDLHVHTTASDGTLEPREIVAEAASIGLTGIAVTDHDTVSGIEEARSFAARQDNFEVIPGIELNTNAGSKEVHILGYFIDSNHDEMLERLVQIREARELRAVEMVRKLNDLGFAIDLFRVRELARGEILARPHVAQAMLEKGYVHSMKEAFDQYIGMGKVAYVPRYKFPPLEAIQLIQKAGGVAVLAHPGLIKDDNMVIQIIDMGIQGLEARYPEHNHNEYKRYCRLAEERGLIITGGSDYHGPNNDDRSRLGCVRTDESVVRALREKVGK